MTSDVFDASEAESLSSRLRDTTLDKLQSLGYTVVEVEGKRYADGSVKQPNADVRMVCHMLLQIEDYDTAILVSGDGDFAPVVAALLERGKRVQVVAFRSQMAQALRESGAGVVFLEGIAKQFAMPHVAMYPTGRDRRRA